MTAREAIGFTVRGTKIMSLKISARALVLPAAALLLSTAISCGRSPQSGPNASGPTGASGQSAVTLLNVSYDPTRELYADYNQAFAKYWKGKTGQDVTIKQSHGGSGKQARSVIDGLEADVVTLGIASDINAIQKAGLINAGWETKQADNNTPYTSTIVFLVRKGNPKGIKDWSDLIRPGVGVITPNPKTSSGGQWNYLAAWGYALQKNANDQTKAQAFVASLYKNVPVLDSGARGATTTFSQRGIGDVLLAWENEANLVTHGKGGDQFQIVNPSVSILAEPSVAVVDKVVDKHGTRDVANAYLQYLYTEEGQTIAAQHFYRPRLDSVAKKFAGQFPNIPLFTVEKTFGPWDQIHKTHFADGGTFDQIYKR